MKYVKLGDLLVKSGDITQAQLDQALALAQSAAAKPLRYAPNADGTWVPAA